MTTTIPAPGDRVRMTGLMVNDPDPIPIGMEGTVTGVNESVRQIYVEWDPTPDGRKRGLILLTEDPFEVVGRADDYSTEPERGH